MFGVINSNVYSSGGGFLRSKTSFSGTKSSLIINGNLLVGLIPFWCPLLELRARSPEQLERMGFLR
eukprot:9219935-Heterocapsa_arctica.AAC.1